MIYEMNSEVWTFFLIFWTNLVTQCSGHSISENYIQRKSVPFLFVKFSNLQKRERTAEIDSNLFLMPSKLIEI